MEIELHPAVSLLEETFNVLIAPVDMLVEALNSHLTCKATRSCMSAATILASSLGWIEISPTSIFEEHSQANMKCTVPDANFDP
jgi:hypothetical protein